VELLVNLPLQGGIITVLRLDALAGAWLCHCTVAYLWEQRLLVIVAFAAKAETGRHGRLQCEFYGDSARVSMGMGLSI